MAVEISEQRSAPASASVPPAWRTAALAAAAPGVLLIGGALGWAPDLRAWTGHEAPIDALAAPLSGVPHGAVALAVVAVLVASASAFVVARTAAPPFGAERTAWLLALSPLTWMALSAPATAAMLALCWGAWATATQRRYAVSGVAAAVAVLCGPAGWLGWLGAVIELVRTRAWRVTGVGVQSLALLLAPITALVATWLAPGGAPLVGRLAATTVGGALPAHDSIWQAVVVEHSPSAPAAVVLLVLLSAAFGRRRWPMARAVTVVAAVLAAVAPEDVARVAVALAPAPVIWVGSLIDRRRSLDAPVLVAATLALAFMAFA